ncbi:MAG: AMP-binding protein [Betaproteobacteria bacterium]|nr:AMP-binding protein [Betaproteobacteria bacterium]
MPQESPSALDTFPRLLLHHARVRGDRPAIREKEYGIWQSWAWAQAADEVRAIACGLAELGFRLIATEGTIRFAVVEDQEQVDKMLEVRASCPLLEHVIYDDPRGMRHYNQPFIHALDEVQAMGAIHNRNHPDFIADEVARGGADDVAIMLYTSGTTGKPKGVCQTHRALIAAARGGQQFDRLTADEDILSYLPMAWVGDNLFSYAQALVTGFTINCPESGDTVMTDMREIGPTYYFAPPRVYENLLTQVMIRMEDAGWVKRGLFHFFMDVAKRCGARILDRASGVSALDRLLYGLGNLLVYAPLRNVLGMSRIRVAYTAGAAIGPDLFRFYRSLGINLKQLYGQTETCAYVCLQPDGGVRLDTVGVPAPGVEVRLADSGEILVRGPMLLKEYYKRPDATAESIDAEGYFHTGDAGFLDTDGHLRIIDRAKDVGHLAGGAMFAPNYIENKLKFFQYIREAVAFGHGRDTVCAFINIDIGAVGNWAERRGIAYSGYTDLAAKKEVYELIQQCVEQVNEQLTGEGELATSQVSRFLILHKELDPDDDELTRTRKVRRGFIAEKYAVLVEALYGGKKSQFIETQVKFEDGRTGSVAADLEIRDVRTFQAVRKAA